MKVFSVIIFLHIATTIFLNAQCPGCHLSNGYVSQDAQPMTTFCNLNCEDVAESFVNCKGSLYLLDSCVCILTNYCISYYTMVPPGYPTSTGCELTFDNGMVCKYGPFGNIPIELSGFAAISLTFDRILLKWTTATETNNAGFELQRSVNNQDFTSIAFVEGAVNSSSDISYEFCDKEVSPNQIYYYRLKQIDMDGAFEYSDVISARSTGDNNEYSLRGNPCFTGELIVDYFSDDEEELRLQVWSIDGQLVKDIGVSNSFDSYTYRIDVSNLISGGYYLKIDSNKGQSVEKILVVN